MLEEAGAGSEKAWKSSGPVHRAWRRAIGGPGGVRGDLPSLTVCRVELGVHGTTERVPAHIWSVPEPCLKEAWPTARATPAGN